MGEVKLGPDLEAGPEVAWPKGFGGWICECPLDEICARFPCKTWEARQQESEGGTARCGVCEEPFAEGDQTLLRQRDARRIHASKCQQGSEGVVVEIEVAEGTGPSYITIGGVRFTIPSQLAMQLVDNDQAAFRLTRVEKARRRPCSEGGSQ